MEQLYNGINLPAQWPPKELPFHVEGNRILPNPPSYLENPPETIDITIGRQLFVDSFLIEKTTLPFSYHQPKKYETNPIFTAQMPWETNENGCSCACPKSGAIIFDPDEQIYKMWYEAGWLNQIAYAFSRDGIHWDRPMLDVVTGTNLILPYTKNDDLKKLKWNGPHYFRADSLSVVRDPDAPQQERYKMLLRNPGGNFPGITLVSPDGIHWQNPRATGTMGDRSTLFYNPFRKKWCFSIRSTWSPSLLFGLDCKGWARTRSYHEDSDFFRASQWQDMNQMKWLCADSLDPMDETLATNGTIPQLYNVDAAPYESIMLGMFQIFLGPENDVSEKTGIPKITGLIPMYSRDGWHWSRPYRDIFIAASRTAGSWDRGYIQSVGGIYTIHDDVLRIYYTGFSGNISKTERSEIRHGMYSGGALGFAEIRRDGFVSLSAASQAGEVLTRTLTFSQGKFLFVNAEKCLLKAEIIDTSGAVIAVSPELEIDSVAAQIPLVDFDAATLQDKRFRIHFSLQHGELYSFWFATDETGNNVTVY